MAENNNPQDFAEKVLQSLKKQSRAVDLSDNNVEEIVVKQATVAPVAPVSQDFTALGQPGGLPGGQTWRTPGGQTKEHSEDTLSTTGAHRGKQTHNS